MNHIPILFSVTVILLLNGLILMSINLDLAAPFISNGCMLFAISISEWIKNKEV